MGGAQVTRSAVEELQSFLEKSAGMEWREPQIVLAARTECRPGNSRHARFLQQKLLHRFRRESRILDIHPRVESTIRCLAAKSGDFIEPGNKLISPFSVLRHHRLHGVC